MVVYNSIMNCVVLCTGLPYQINYLIKGDHMNGKDILLYTLCAAGTLYALWIIINMVWFGILSLYHRIADEIAFYQWKNRR